VSYCKINLFLFKLKPTSHTVNYKVVDFFVNIDVFKSRIVSELLKYRFILKIIVLKNGLKKP